MPLPSEYSQREGDPIPNIIALKMSSWGSTKLKPPSTLVPTQAYCPGTLKFDCSAIFSPFSHSTQVFLCRTFPTRSVHVTVLNNDTPT